MKNKASSGGVVILFCFVAAHTFFIKKSLFPCSCSFRKKKTGYVKKTLKTANTSDQFSIAIPDWISLCQIQRYKMTELLKKSQLMGVHNNNNKLISVLLFTL